MASTLSLVNLGYKNEIAQLCSILCDPMDCSLPGSSIHGIFQARVLEWVVIAFSRGSSRPRDRTRVSHIVGGCFTIWATKDSVFIFFPCLCSSLQRCFCLIVSMFVFHIEAPHRYWMNFGFLRVWGLEGWGQALSASGCCVLSVALLLVGGLGNPCHWRNTDVRILKLVRFPKDDFSIPRPRR